MEGYRWTVSTFGLLQVEAYPEQKGTLSGPVFLEHRVLLAHPEQGLEVTKVHDVGASEIKVSQIPVARL